MGPSYFQKQGNDHHPPVKVRNIHSVPLPTVLIRYFMLDNDHVLACLQARLPVPCFMCCKGKREGALWEKENVARTIHLFL